MDIQLEKREAINMLQETNDPSIIKAVIELLTKKKKDWWDDLTDAQKAVIKLGEEQIEKGEFSDFETMMKKHI
ncbi:hypothetical protein [Flavobacterium sp. N502540]|uniref:hypothetical protein n=1 Tax=Flavobacterium sp. N502540 TaxID=2986838 RepID=UPI00222424F5|nr:hypothetical protein [Flavobacterium sp. N502540]